MLLLFLLLLGLLALAMLVLRLLHVSMLLLMHANVFCSCLCHQVIVSANRQAPSSKLSGHACALPLALGHVCCLSKVPALLKWHAPYAICHMPATIQSRSVDWMASICRATW